jgi:hypothetical protein
MRLVQCLRRHESMPWSAGDDPSAGAPFTAQRTGPERPCMRAKVRLPASPGIARCGRRRAQRRRTAREHLHRMPTSKRIIPRAAASAAAPARAPAQPQGRFRGWRSPPLPERRLVLALQRHRWPRRLLFDSSPRGPPCSFPGSSAPRRLRSARRRRLSDSHCGTNCGSRQFARYLASWLRCLPPALGLLPFWEPVAPWPP